MIEQSYTYISHFHAIDSINNVLKKYTQYIVFCACVGLASIICNDTMWCCFVMS